MPANDPITTSVTHRDGVAVVAVSGDVDVATVATLEESITEALATKPTALIIDLSDVDFLASAGLQTLVATNEAVTKTTTGFAVVAHGPATSRPIQLTGLDQVFSLYPTLAEAIAAVSAASQN
ncbi:STAS domain-containing protein [Mycolicibacterium elephantis]|uniref:Anti-sigma factor antagonist n=1 Tax=Mycolicibacterium elephantis TaxID=81858 RepID=A0A0M2ZDZ6_9MYCO|nr:STAS domain-containing protein [Mycolicibacterium elephantis]KKW62033.1 anti-anti-sigma factor [Mycolicibacterium elephantis]OBA69301.1 anti-anti-sigma factor [Mycolicibacterium elephantis]OBB20233.1 anti-anti-sigma factor [Mycolicibacterium elephantis]OBF00930.1 anti-anti-sigma factor [Mycolicibacterium elephantis]ORA63341.1 anti-anti-sigma factor [Mycolicibacterium elephantis]